MENQTDFKVTKLIVQFSVDCFLLTSGRGGFASVQIHKEQKPECWSVEAKFGPVSLAVPLGVTDHLSLSLSHKSQKAVHTYSGHTVYRLDSRWNRWVSCWSHMRMC